jgi:hypothetical protein
MKFFQVSTEIAYRRFAGVVQAFQYLFLWGFVLQGHTGILALHMCSVFSLVQLATFLTGHGDLILIMRILFVCPSLAFHQG